MQLRVVWQTLRPPVTLAALMKLLLMMAMIKLMMNKTASDGDARPGLLV